jgi:hypothetical protein
MLHKMDAIADEEIKEAYDNLSEDEFFDCGYDIDQVDRVLGKSVANDYTNWMYLTLK